MSRVVMTAKDIELGKWSRRGGGRTATFYFFVGDKRIGTLVVSHAGLKWWKTKGRWEVAVPVKELNEMFYSHHVRLKTCWSCGAELP